MLEIHIWEGGGRALHHVFQSWLTWKQMHLSPIPTHKPQLVMPTAAAPPPPACLPPSLSPSPASSKHPWPSWGCPMWTPDRRPKVGRPNPGGHEWGLGPTSQLQNWAPPHLVMVSSVAWDVISQILMLLSNETEATFWLSGSKQHAVRDRL